MGKIITPTWSTQPTAVAGQATVCRIDDNKTSASDTAREKLSPEPSVADKSGLSKLISNVKRTPSVSVADSVKDQKQSKFNSLPRKQKPERSSVRNLEISNPILQTDIEHRSSLVPVCRSSESPGSETSSLSSTTPAIREMSPRRNSPVSTKRPAPPPPVRPVNQSERSVVSDQSEDSACSKPASGSSKSKLFPWRSSNTNKSSKESEASDANVHKVSSSDDILSYKKPSESSKSTSGKDKYTSKRRPASIATSKPTRPQAPPPKPPSSRKNSQETSADDTYLYDDAFALRQGKAPLADIQESLSPGHNTEPIYDTISEAPELTSSPDDFETPVSSPVFAKKKSFDAQSTGSSAAEEDFMAEILKEMHTKTEGESIYSSLMRKKNKDKKKKVLE